MQWTPSHLIDKLTICVFSRNLFSLHYPIVESIASTIKLGCNYLIGDASSDNTISIFNELSKYIPLTITKLQWRLDTEPGYKAAAIGIGTQDTIAQCQTAFAYNLQASEILDEDAITGILTQQELQPSQFKFRHFYGSMHRGGYAYHGYGEAPRLFRAGTKFDTTDACYPNNYDGGYNFIHGHINRYGYCWHNTIVGKCFNKLQLYDNEKTSIEACQNFFESGKEPQYQIYPRNAHPPCVQHLIDLDNYDIDFSLNWFKNTYKSII